MHIAIMSLGANADDSKDRAVKLKPYRNVRFIFLYNKTPPAIEADGVFVHLNCQQIVEFVLRVKLDTLSPPPVNIFLLSDF